MSQELKYWQPNKNSSPCNYLDKCGLYFCVDDHKNDFAVKVSTHSAPL